MSMDNKKHLRAIVRRVHPDLFTAYPAERQRNSESLKVRTYCWMKNLDAEAMVAAVDVCARSVDWVAAANAQHGFRDSSLDESPPFGKRKPPFLTMASHDL